MTEKFLRAQLSLLSPLLEDSSLETIRKGQNLVGEIMTAAHRIGIKLEERDLGDFKCEWITPKDSSRRLRLCFGFPLKDPHTLCGISPCPGKSFSCGA